MFKYLIFLLIISCVPQGGNITPGPGAQGAFAPAPDITHLTISGSQLILDGSNFDGVTHLSLKNSSNGSVKPFNVISATFSKLISESIDAASIPMGKGLELILSNAYGQSTFPVTFSLQPNSIDRTHIKNAEVTLNKLDPGTDRTPGKVIKWDGTKFYMGTDTGGGGGGGSITLDLGSGLTGSSNPIIDSGLISVDIGITGDPNATKIPYFNSTNQLEVAGNAEILFSDPSNTNFSLFNNSGQFTIQKGNVSPAYFIMHSSGRVEVPVELFVKGFPVCNSNGDDCPGAFGSSITNITVSPPLTGGGVGPTVNISPGLVNTPNNLVKLDGTGGLPVGIKGVVNSVTAGTATYVTPASTGAITVGVVFGAGNAQRYQTYLDNLGTLNPNDNYVVIGNGTSWEVQGGDTLLTTLGAQKADADLSSLAGLSPATGNIIVGAGTTWNTSTIPILCPNGSGNVVVANGTSFSCTNNASPFSAGTITTFNPVGLQLKAPSPGTSTGELHFLGTNNSNYVGLKAADATASNTVWTLPATDGTSGYALTTDGSGKLSWINVGAGNDVSNPGTSTMGNLASFSSGTGKVIQDSGIIAANVVTNSGISLDNAIPRFSGTGGTIIQNSGVTIDGSNNVSGIQNLTVKGNNSNTPSTATPTTAINFMIGRNNLGALVTPAQSTADLAFEYGGIGFKHYLTTTHNSSANSNQNSFRFYVNNTNTVAGSSQPGTGNVLAMTITPLGVGILNSTPTNALDITGNTVMTGSLTINNNGTNSSTFPTTRGTNGQVLTAAAAGAMSWATPATGTVTGTGTDSHIMKWLGTTAAQDSGIIIDSSNNVTGMGTLNTRTIANWVDGPGSATATNLAAFSDINGKAIQDSGLLTANIPIMTSNGVAGNLIQTAAANKALSDSAIKVADVVTKSSNFSAPFRVLLALNSTSRNATETGYTIPTSVCANTLVLKSDGANMTCQADLNSGDVLGPASSTTNTIAKFSDGTGKILANSGVIIDGSNNVSGTNAFTSSGNMTVDTNTFFVNATADQVGIGTQSPYRKLDVVGDIITSVHGTGTEHDPSEIIGLRRIGHTSSTNLAFAGMGLTVKDVESDGTTARANNAHIGFYTWGNSIWNSKEVIRITERGRLGINTTNPTALLHVIGNAQIGTQGPTVAPFNVGVARLSLTGPNGNAGGPHISFNTDSDIYPQRHFLNWAHDNIWDCFDCYYDGTNLRNSTSSSSFRWYKSATDLILLSDPNPTAGGISAQTNKFWINKAGTVNIAGDLNLGGYLMEGSALARVVSEEVRGFTPPSCAYNNGWPGGAGTNPLPPNGTRNCLAVSDGNYTSPVYLPAVAANGAVWYYFRQSTSSWTVKNERTDMPGDVVINNGWLGTFISNGTTWIYQGQVPNSGRILIGSTTATGLGSPGQVLTTDGAGSLSWETNSVTTMAITGTGTDGHLMRWKGTNEAQDTGISIDEFNSLTGVHFINGKSLDGIVYGPGSAVDNRVAFFNGTSGSVIRDSGILYTDLITKVSDFTSANRVALSSGNNRLLDETAYTIPVADGTANYVLKTNGAGVVSWEADTTQGASDVQGPGSATDYAIALFNGTSGKLIRNSAVTINSSNDITGGRNLNISGNGYLTGTSFIELGSSVSGKEGNAGKIGYNTFATGSGATGLLNIIGGGTNSSNRSTRFWDRVGIGMDPTNTLDVGGTLRTTGNTNIGGTLTITPDNSNINFGTWGGGVGRISSNLVYSLNDGESNMSFYTRRDPGGLMEMARIDGNSGNFMIRGSVQGGQFSDNSLKENISDLSFESSLDFIKKLRPVEFKWNAQGGKFFPQTKNEKHYGFIAQDVERILPGMVTKNELSGYKSLEYHEVIPFLVRAVQEQQKTIESLTGKPLYKDNLLGNEKIPTEFFNNPESLLIIRPEKESGMESETEKLKREISLLREQNQRIQKQLDAINARLNPKVSSD